MEIRPPRDRAEQRTAFACLIDRDRGADPLVLERVHLLEDYARRRKLSLEHCLVLASGKRIHAACLFLDSPGRTSSVLLSPIGDNPQLRSGLLELLRQAEREAIARNVQLLQGMVPPECAEEATLYDGAGFEQLATLLYMQNDLACLRIEPPRRNLDWETYSPKTHAMFIQVVEGTYEGSLDCSSLNGVRRIEDIFASHQATGQYDPYYWRLGLSRGKPVGVILLACVEEQQTFEVVYMGCLPKYRSQGYGSSFLAHGVELACRRGVSALSLSVDEKNEPARRLYAAFGFEEVMRRDVWIKILQPPLPRPLS